MEEPNSRRLTLEEYLALEAVSPDRTEYRDGFAVALAAPNKNHGRISRFLTMKLGPILESRGCDFYTGDAKIGLADRGLPLDEVYRRTTVPRSNDLRAPER